MTPEMVLELMKRTVKDAVTFKQYTNGWYGVTFPYDAQVVALLKCVPTCDRRYLPDTRTWLVAFRFAQPLMEILREQGYHLEVIEA